MSVSVLRKTSRCPLFLMFLRAHAGQLPLSVEEREDLQDLSGLISIIGDGLGSTSDGLPHLRAPLQLSLLISPLYLFCPVQLYKRSFNRQQMLSTCQMLGNGKPDILIDIEKAIWRVVFILAEGRHDPMPLLRQLCDGLPWDRIKSAKDYWFDRSESHIAHKTSTLNNFVPPLTPGTSNRSVNHLLSVPTTNVSEDNVSKDHLFLSHAGTLSCSAGLLDPSDQWPLSLESMMTFQDDLPGIDPSLLLVGALPLQTLATTSHFPSLCDVTMEEVINESSVSESSNPATISGGPQSILEGDGVMHGLDEKVSTDIGGDGGLDEGLAAEGPDGIGNIVGADENMDTQGLTGIGDATDLDGGTGMQGTGGMEGDLSSQEDEDTDRQGTGGMGGDVSEEDEDINGQGTVGKGGDMSLEEDEDMDRQGTGGEGDDVSSEENEEVDRQDTGDKGGDVSSEEDDDVDRQGTGGVEGDVSSQEDSDSDFKIRHRKATVTLAEKSAPSQRLDLDRKWKAARMPESEDDENENENDSFVGDLVNALNFNPMWQPETVKEFVSILRRFAPSKLMPQRQVAIEEISLSRDRAPAKVLCDRELEAVDAEGKRHRFRPQSHVSGQFLQHLKLMLSACSMLITMSR